MYRGILAVAAILSATLSATAQETPPPDRSWHGHVSWCPGVKFLDGDWKPAGVQANLGLVDFDFTPRGWPVGFAAQLLMSYSKKVPDELPDGGLFPIGGIGSTGTYGWNFGLRRAWELSPGLELFAGGGVSFIGALVQADAAAPGGSGAKDHDDDFGLGFWAGAGGYASIGPATSLGFQIEYSRGKVTLFDETFDAGGVAALLSIGYRW